MQVSFHNGTRAQSGEATSSRHTSPADFRLVVKETAVNERPRVGPGCPDWRELNIARGADAGPETLCFPPPPPDTHISLVWSPDLGFFFNEVAIPLS
jgi:hypothetical protein